MRDFVLDVSGIEELKVRADNSVSFNSDKSLLVLGDKDKSDDSCQLPHPTSLRKTLAR